MRLILPVLLTIKLTLLCQKCDLHFKFQEDWTKTAVTIKSDRYFRRTVFQMDRRTKSYFKWFYTLSNAMNCIEQTITRLAVAKLQKNCRALIEIKSYRKYLTTTNDLVANDDHANSSRIQISRHTDVVTRRATFHCHVGTWKTYTSTADSSSITVANRRTLLETHTVHLLTDSMTSLSCNGPQDQSHFTVM